MKKYLFIGGPLDGKWKLTEGEQKVLARIPEDLPLPLSKGVEVAPEAAFWHYAMRPLHFGGGFVSVYVLEGLTNSEALRLLLLGYKP